MADEATPNLPARSFDLAEAFYAKLGFTLDYRDNGWMILSRGSLTLEFFPYPDLDPSMTSFSCCLRLDDLDSFVTACVAAEVPDAQTGWPRLHPPKLEDSGLRLAYLIDPDGSLLRLIQND